MAIAISVPLYTVEDLEHFPDDGNRYELLDGVLLVTPQAAAVHQVVANRIQFELTASLQKPGLAHVVGPGAVVRMPRTQLQPDVLVYPARFSPTTDWRKITEHWLAVEILSRSSRVYDRDFKRDAYFALGLQQCGSWTGANNRSRYAPCREGAGSARHDALAHRGCGACN